MHRVRVGLIGLCSVFLLVMLAAVVLRTAGRLSQSDNNATPMVNEAAPNDPLGQLGVAPGNPLSDIAENRAAPPAKSR